jgi:hypothetical protein
MHVHSRTPTRLSRKVRILGAVLAAVLALVLMIGTHSVWTVLSADRCFRDVIGFVPSQTPLREVKSLLRYRAFAFEQEPCSPQDCSISFSFEDWLSWWGLLGQRRALQGHVRVRNGVIETIHFFYAQGGSTPVSVTEGPDEADPEKPGLPVGLSIIAVGDQGHESAVRIPKFGATPANLRDKMLRPNAWCLVRLGGCSSLHQILPGTDSVQFRATR